MRRLVPFLLPLIGLTIFLWIVRGTGVDNIIRTFRRVEPTDLLVFPLFVAFFVIARGLRWLVLMRTLGVRYDLRRAATVWSIGFFAAAVTPAKVGDALRAYYLSRETGADLGRCVLTVVIDRLMDLFTVVLAGVVTTLVFSYSYMHLPSVWMVGLILLGFIGGVYLAMHRDLMRKLIRPFFRALTPRRYQDELTRHFHNFYDGLRVYATRWPLTLFAYALTLVFWTGVVLLAYTVTRVLGIHVDFKYVLIMMPVVTLVEALPVSVSGLGTREAAVIYFFSAIGVSSAEAVGFSLLYVIIGTYLTAAVGFVAWLAKPARFGAGGPPTGTRSSRATGPSAA